LALDKFRKAAGNTTVGRRGEYYYSLVLTDIRMPTMNGFDLYQKIKGIDNNIKVRFLTASEINYDEFRKKVAPTIDDAENCFITKPMANQKLLNEISKLMKMKNM
jgi:CheY-like chemotaxis protein